MNDRIETHLRETDAFAWYMEHDALLRSTVVAVVKLERAPDWERLVGRVDRATGGCRSRWRRRDSESRPRFARCLCRRHR